MKNKISIEVYQHDWIPGFAAFHVNGQLNENAKAHVVLNLGAMLEAVAVGDMEASEVPYFVAESIMHEVIHVLESWAGVEFNEERVTALIEKYASPNSGKGRE